MTCLKSDQMQKGTTEQTEYIDPTSSFRFRKESDLRENNSVAFIANVNVLCP